MCGHGKTERVVRRRAQPEANAWRTIEGVMADRRISKRLKGQDDEHLCDIGNDRTTTTKATSVRKQLGTKNGKSNVDRQEKNDGVRGRDGSAEELDRETGEEQTTVGRTRRKYSG